MSSPIDVIVLGSGASALTAALAAQGHGASVEVFEKASHLGGTSAWSGDMIWIPNNHHAQACAVNDSPEDALTFLDALSHDMIDYELALAFIEHGPEMVRWMEQNTLVKFQLVPDFPDYHPEHPGGTPQEGHSLECPLYSFNELGQFKDWVTIGHNYGKAPITMDESHLGRAVPVEVSLKERQRQTRND